MRKITKSIEIDKETFTPKPGGIPGDPRDGESSRSGTLSGG